MKFTLGECPLFQKNKIEMVMAGSKWLLQNMELKLIICMFIKQNFILK